MLTILILLVVGSLVILVVLLFLLVVIGIRNEPPTEELSEQAPSLITAFARRLLGVSIRRPDSPPRLGQGDKGHFSLLAGPVDKPDLG
jgi:hypothetical protein